MYSMVFIISLVLTTDRVRSKMKIRNLQGGVKFPTGGIKLSV